MGRLELITGLPRSGKSELAEGRVIAAAGSGERLYVATLPRLRCYAGRIALHERRRDATWRVVEIRRDLLSEAGRPLVSLDGPRIVLLDGVSNYLARLVDTIQTQFAVPAERGIVERCAGAIRRLRSLSDVLVVVGTIASPLPNRDLWERSLVRWNERLLQSLADSADETITLEGTTL